MIRTVLGFFIVALGLCVYIVMGPSGDDSAAADATAEVTRAAEAPTTIPTAPVVAETAAATPTEAPTGMVNSAASRILAASGGTQAKVDVPVKTDGSTLEQTSLGVLAALGVTTEPVAAPADKQNPEMADATANALAAIRGITGESAEPAVTESNDLQQLVAWALKEGQTDTYIDTLVNEAARNGEVSVPQMLVTSDGRVDTATLLASIVEQANVATGGEVPAVPETPLGEADGVEVRVVQRADDTEQYRFYTVASGDSLGSIAHKFYGSASRYPVIFEANRDLLSSPDQIQAGQRLTIPDLS